MRKVFISYSRKDIEFAERLSKDLEKGGLKVWWDFEKLKGGQDWQIEIERAIKQCEFFLVVLTPDAVSSEWVGNEITYANKAQKTIIPLLLKECEIPISLVKKQYIDFANDYSYGLKWLYSAFADTFAEVKKLIADLYGVDESKITPETPIRDIINDVVNSKSRKGL